MRIVLVLICSFALACVAAGAQKEQKGSQPAPKKKQAQAGQVSQTGRETTRQASDSGKIRRRQASQLGARQAGGGEAAKDSRRTQANGLKPVRRSEACRPQKGKGKGKHAEAGKAAGAGEARSKPAQRWAKQPAQGSPGRLLQRQPERPQQRARQPASHLSRSTSIFQNKQTPQKLRL